MLRVVEELGVPIDGIAGTSVGAFVVTFGDTIWGGSLFFGMDTLVGPVYLAGGLAEEGNTSLYLFIGSTF